MNKSIELQKQARENALEVGAYVKGLGDWAEEMKELEQNAKAQESAPDPPEVQQNKSNPSPKPSYHPKREREVLPVWDSKDWTKTSVPEISKQASIPTSYTESNPKVNALKESGNKMFAKGNYQKAIEFYSEALQLTQTNQALYSNRAQCYLNLKKYAEAEKDAEMALSIEPSNLKALFRRSKAHVGLGEYSRAKVDLMMLLYLDPKNAAISSLLRSIIDKEGGTLEPLDYPTDLELKDEPQPIILKDGHIVNKK